MISREKSESPVQSRKLTRELTSDEIEVVSGGLLFLDYLRSQIPPDWIELHSVQFNASQTGTAV